MLSRQDGNFQEKKTMITFGRFILPLTAVIAVALLFFSIKLFFYTPLTPDSDAIMETESKQIEEIIKSKEEATQEELPNESVAAKKNAPRTSAADSLAKSKNKDEEHVAIVLARPVKAKKSAVAKQQTQKKSSAVAKPIAQPEKHTEEKKALKARTDTAVKKTSVQSAKKETARDSAKREKQGRQTASSDKKEQKANAGAKTQAEKQETKNVKKRDAAAAEKSSAAENKKAEKSDTAPKAQTQQKASDSVSRWDVQIGVFSDKKNAGQIMQKAKSEGYAAYIIEGKVNDKAIYRIRVKGGKDKAEAQKLSDELKKKGYEVYLTATE